jgi:hypothetical protein
VIQIQRVSPQGTQRAQRRKEEEENNKEDILIVVFSLLFSALSAFSAVKSLSSNVRAKPAP